MAKVTSKCQVTVPKAIAERYSIRPGDHIDWQPAGDVIRVIPSKKQSSRKTLSRGKPSLEKAVAEERAAMLRLFDQATERHRGRPLAPATNQARGRGWTREDLYLRGRSR